MCRHLPSGRLLRCEWALQLIQRFNETLDLEEKKVLDYQLKTHYVLCDVKQI